MKKKIIILTSVVMMGLALFGCGNKGDNNSDKESQKNNNEQADNNNQYVIINGKTYDLSKDCGEVLQEFIDDMFVENCKWEDEAQLIRKMESIQEYDEEKGLDITEIVYYQLDKDGNYVETEQKDFDERVMIRLDSAVGTMGNMPKELEEVKSFTISYNHILNASDFQMITPSGIGIGSDKKELENAPMIGKSYVLMYLDGELVNWSDYYKDAERIQKLDDSQWAQERKEEYKYQHIFAESYAAEFNKMSGDESAVYYLAAADMEAKLASGENETNLVFYCECDDEKVTRIYFSVVKQSDRMKNDYEDFINNK